jgi:hypothetical protein
MSSDEQFVRAVMATIRDNNFTDVQVSAFHHIRVETVREIRKRVELERSGHVRAA